MAYSSRYGTLIFSVYFPLTLGFNELFAVSSASLAVVTRATSGGFGRGEGSTSGTVSRLNFGCHRRSLLFSTLIGGLREERNV